MAVASGRRGEPHEGATRRFVLETLRAFASEFVSERILEAALHAAREIDVPEHGPRLRRFVERHLPAAVGAQLGAETAQMVTEALRPMAHMLPDPAETSRVRARDQVSTKNPPPPEPERRERPSLAWSATPPSSTPEAQALPVEPSLMLDDRPTATPPELALPMVILASRAEGRAAEIRTWLGGRAALQLAQDAVKLLSCVEVAMNLAPVLLIDCVEPAVQLPTLLLLAPELPAGATVVLWGLEDDAVFDELALEQGAARFIRCGPEATSRDVGALLSPFISR